MCLSLSLSPSPSPSLPLPLTQTPPTPLKDIDDRVRTSRKEVRSELGRLEKLFSRSYSLLQLHQLAVTEKLVSVAASSITPVRETVS